MTESISMDAALERLKQNQILYTIESSKRYYRLIENIVWIKDDQLSLKLSLEDFILQFGSKSFFVHSLESEMWIDETKDIDYYIWREKSQ